MYIQNRRNNSKFKGWNPLQNCNGLIGLKPAIAYFAYTHRCRFSGSLTMQKYSYIRINGQGRKNASATKYTCKPLCPLALLKTPISWLSRLME